MSNLTFTLPTTPTQVVVLIMGKVLVETSNHGTISEWAQLHSFVIIAATPDLTIRARPADPRRPRPDETRFGLLDPTTVAGCVGVWYDGVMTITPVFDDTDTWIGVWP